MGCLKKYKEKECKTWVGKFFQRLVFTWLYKIITALVLVVISAILFNFTKEGSFWDSLLSSLYGIGFFGFLIIAITFLYKFTCSGISKRLV